MRQAFASLRDALHTKCPTLVCFPSFISALAQKTGFALFIASILRYTGPLSSLAFLILDLLFFLLVEKPMW